MQARANQTTPATPLKCGKRRFEHVRWFDDLKFLDASACVAAGRMDIIDCTQSMEGFEKGLGQNHVGVKYWKCVPHRLST